MPKMLPQHFKLKRDVFEITQIVSMHLGHFVRKFVDKIFQKSSNLVTLSKLNIFTDKIELIGCQSINQSTVF